MFEASSQGVAARLIFAWWGKESLDHYRKARQGLDRMASGDSDRRPIHPRYVASIIDQLAADDAIFTFDVGTPASRRLVGSLTHGSMANALPQAIGAQVSHPSRQVITMSGDGGLAMLMRVLLTLRAGNEGGGILDFATNLHHPDFSKIAEAAGLLV